MAQARFGPDDRSIVGGGLDGTVRIWPLDGGDPIVLYGHDGAVNTVAFSPDGKWIVSGGSDKTVRLWEADGGPTRVVLRRHDSAVIGVAFAARGEQVLSAAGDGIVLSPCEVCGPFSDILDMARRRPAVKLSAAERARIEASG
jgi:WD40 repeat protein